jgi:hypothetical protein
VIPTLILAGLLVGRWWALAVAAVAWPVLADAGSVEADRRAVGGHDGPGCEVDQ